MLANSFLPAEALNITELQQRTLVQVLGMLERGEMKHISLWREIWNSVFTIKSPTKNGFNMSWWSPYPAECETPGCIAGWCDYLTEGQTSFVIGGYRFKGTELGRLFFPTFRSWRSPQRAASALRSYLTTGAPNWY